MKSRVMRAVVVVVVLVCSVAALTGVGYAVRLIGLIGYTRGQADAVRNGFFCADHEAILEGCRQMMADQEKYRREWPQVHEPGYGYVIWDRRSGPLGEDVPRAVRSLDPIVLKVASNELVVRLPSEGSLEYCIAFAKGAKEYGTRRMISGLWYWDPVSTVPGEVGNSVAR